MTCTRRDFVSGAGAIAVVASTGLATSVTLATENEPKKFAMRWYTMKHLVSAVPHVWTLVEPQTKCQKGFRV